MVELEVKQAYPEEKKLLLRCRRCGKEVEENVEIPQNNNLDEEELEE